MTRHRSNSGQALAVVAASMVVILGFLGLGIDLGYLRYLKRLVQRNADAAAIAGAAEIPSCGSTPDCSYMQTAAQTALTENGFSGATVMTGSCTPGTTGLVVIVNNPPQCVSTDPHLGQPDYVEVIVSQTTPLNFATVFGAPPVTLTARSEAAMASDLIIALDQSGSRALNVENAGVTVTSMGGVVDESSSGSAFNCPSGTTFTAPYIGVVGQSGGGGSRHFVRNYDGCSYPQASPQFGVPLPEFGAPNGNPDPLYTQQISLENTAPSTGNCGTSTSSPYTGSSSELKLTNGTFVLNPGTYCGGIVIGQVHIGPTIVTFNPGIYTLTGAGGLQIDSFATVTANGVGFYNFGSGAINIVNNFGLAGGVTLTAPDSTNCPSCPTAWQGMLFFQDPTNTTAGTVVGSATYNVAVTGTSYFPGATVNYANNSTAVDYNLLVAKDINMGVEWGGAWIGAYFFNLFNRHHIRSPLHGTGGTGVVE